MLTIEQSWFYRLGRKRDLAALLNLSLSELKALTNDKNFEPWEKTFPDGKKRLIEEPQPQLKKALTEVQKILSHIQTPPWLMSGKKKIQPRDNAIAHIKNAYMISVDIAKFYQNSKREFVYTLFRDDFKQTTDIASLLADLVTYNGHIPTGAPSSQLLAFWTYRKTLEKIHAEASRQHITMTVWVDDITFSSRKPLPKNWLTFVKRSLDKTDLHLKKEKIKFHGQKDHKITTGSAISPKGVLKVKNQKRLEILSLIKSKKIEQLTLKEARSLLGKLTAQRQNEPDFFSSTYIRCKKHLRNLEKMKQKESYHKKPKRIKSLKQKPAAQSR
ncbi:MAG: RNA-directed DNA polymerase [Alphaproteobacteria bacterium]|nr:RNA-directed DNA polymerase [Alphaproteobacteria bacterium]